MPTPLVSQGSLNRLRASIVFNDFPSLNVTSPYLGKEGIKLTLEGEATSYLGAMTGAVPSPQPYQICSLTINLLKSQSFSDLYKQQFETNTLMGNVTVRPDAATLSPYPLYNFVLEAVREQNYSGEDPGFVVSGKGIYYLNNSIWQA